MSSEKMQILKMLEEGKINADDAARLLQSVGADTSPPRSERPMESGRSNNQAPPPSAGSFTGFDSFANDLGRKFGVLAKDMEPKLQKLVGTVAEKTADMAEKISRNMNEAKPAAVPHTTTVQRTPSAAPSASRNFELTVAPGYNELNLAALNGDLCVKGYNGDKITVRVFARELGAAKRLELMRLGNRYYLSYDEEAFKTVSIDALVPESMFNSIFLSTSNGRTEASSISCEHFTVQSTNGAAILRNIRSNNIKSDTSGRLSIDGLTAQNAHIENAAGEIDANGIEVTNLHLINSNGVVSMTAADLNQPEYTWIVETSNGKLSLNVPSSPRIGYHIKANTLLGSVRLGLPSLNYATNSPNAVEATSAGYSSAACRVRLSAETSNAGLSVN